MERDKKKYGSFDRGWSAEKTGFVGGLLLHTNDAENPVEAEAGCMSITLLLFI